MTLIQFLTFWSHFVATHHCWVQTVGEPGTPDTTLYGGSCGQAFGLAKSVGGIVSWLGNFPMHDHGTFSFHLGG